jgi:predicted MFS family arabinose efflux permease
MNPYSQIQRDHDSAHWALVYIITGAFSIVVGELIGRAANAVGKLKVFALGCALIIVMIVIYTHLHESPLWAFIGVPEMPSSVVSIDWRMQ